MTKSTYYLLIAACMALLSACEKASFLTSSAPHIRFDQPAEGMQSRYVLFRGDDYYDENNNTVYYPDTLIVSVLSQNDQGWLVEEKLSPGSASRLGKDYTYDPDSVYYYYLTTENLLLNVAPGPKRSWVASRLFQHNAAPLPLKPVGEPIADLQGWRMKPACFEFCVNFDPSYTLFDVVYKNLNLYTDARPTFVDGRGIFYAYSAETGIVKSLRFGGWNSKVWGWDLLPE